MIICELCTESFNENDQYVATPCGKIYHANCIKQFQDQESNICAGCKKQFGKALARCYFSFASVQQAKLPDYNSISYQASIAQQTKIEEKLRINLALRRDLNELQHTKISQIAEKNGLKNKEKKLQQSLCEIRKRIVDKQNALIDIREANLAEKFVQLQMSNTSWK